MRAATCRQIARIFGVFATIVLQLPTASMAAAPAIVPMHGAMTTTGGGPATDGKYTLVIRLYASHDAKAELYKEIHVAVPVQRGGFQIALGATEPAKNPLPVKAFATGAVWIGVQVDADPELPRARANSTPFALHASSAEHAKTADSAKSADTAKAADTAKTAGTLSKALDPKLIGPGAITALHAGFTFAGSKTKGGPADKALLADKATAADKATTADEAVNAKWAGGLKCTGCVAATHVSKTFASELATAGQLAKVAISGDFKDLKGGPDLTGVGQLGKANVWTEKQAFAKGASIGADTSFNKFQAQLMRVHNAEAAPVKCDASMAGGLYFNTKNKRFYGCDGAQWQAFTAGQNSQANPATSCAALLKEGKTDSGMYWLTLADGKAYPVYCDQKRAGGGWMLVFHVFTHSGMSNNKFIAATGHHNFTDATWQLQSGTIVTGNNAASPEPGKVTGALDIALFKGLFDDVRMSCNQATGNLAEQHYAVIAGFAKANGNHKLLGAANNGKPYTVDKTLNSHGKTTIWVDNEINGVNSGHYMCDMTNGGSNGTSQFGFCYTNFLNNPNNLDHGDSIVAIAFGHQKGDDSWSKGFSGECGNMGTAYLSDKGTFSIYVR